MQTADTMAQSERWRKEKLERIQEVDAVYQEILEASQCVELRELAVTGRDLIAIGLQPGPGIGELLNAALEQVLEDPQKNTREYLLEFCRKRLEK